MHRIEAQILGALIGALAITGFFIEGSLLFELINVELALDITRAVLAVALLVVGLGRFSDTIVRSVMGFVGGLFVLIGALAFVDPLLFGALSIGMTGFDIGMHLVVGVAAVALAVVPERSLGRRPTATPPHQTV